MGHIHLNILSRLYTRTLATGDVDDTVPITVMRSRIRTKLTDGKQESQEMTFISEQEGRREQEGKARVSSNLGLEFGREEKAGCE